MRYTEQSTIKTVKDVETFFYYLTMERHLNFHPDDSFSQYINLETRKPSFSPQEVILYDRLMNEAFKVCEKEGRDIYEIGLTYIKKAFL